MPRIPLNDFPNYDEILQPGWRIADYGGGTNPYPGAHVVVDNNYGGWDGKDAREMGFETRQGDVQNLKGIVADKEFDFVIASHVAEHVDNPVAFCREMMRTAKGGYIETPSPLYETFFQWAEHRWAVTTRGDALCFMANEEERVPGRMIFDAFGGTGPYEHLRARHEPLLRTRFLWKDSFKWIIEG